MNIKLNYFVLFIHSLVVRGVRTVLKTLVEGVKFPFNEAPLRRRIYSLASKFTQNVSLYRKGGDSPGPVLLSLASLPSRVLFISLILRSGIWHSHGSQQHCSVLTTSAEQWSPIQLLITFNAVPFRFPGRDNCFTWTCYCLINFVRDRNLKIVHILYILR